MSWWLALLMAVGICGPIFFVLALHIRVVNSIWDDHSHGIIRRKEKQNKK